MQAGDSVARGVAILTVLVVLTGCASSPAGSSASIGGSASVSATGSVDGTGTAGSATAETVGASLVKRKCTRCHSIERVEKARKARDGWTRTIGRMRSHGLQATDAERAAIVEYLTLRDGSR